jgi:hypothetical protein
MVVLLSTAATARPDDFKERDNIKVPDGHKLVAWYQAKGVQVYKAVPAKAGGFQWQFEEPLADLLDTDGGKAGIHYIGPSWEAADGSKVRKDDGKDPNPKSADALKKDRDVPWLLIAVKADEAKDAKPGIFTKVVYVQRVSTSGGVEPKELPKRAGAKIAVPYTAVYYFWAKE